MKIARGGQRRFWHFCMAFRGSAWLDMPAINVLGFYTATLFSVTLPLISRLVGHMLQLLKIVRTQQEGLEMPHDKARIVEIVNFMSSTCPTIP